MHYIFMEILIIWFIKNFAKKDKTNPEYLKTQKEAHLIKIENKNLNAL